MIHCLIVLNRTVSAFAVIIIEVVQNSRETGKGFMQKRLTNKKSIVRI